MSVWYALLDGSQDDVMQVKRFLSNLDLAFDEVGGKLTLSAPEFQHCNNKNEVIQAAEELLAAINTSLRLSVKTYKGFELDGLLEKRHDGTEHHTMFAKGATFTISGSAAVLMLTSYGRAVRSIEERLVSLLRRDPSVVAVAAVMTISPMTWLSINIVYESVKRLTSPNARQDHQGLIDRGWINAEQSESLYCTAKYHRHGYPRTPIKEGVREMPLSEASQVITNLFWRLVDDLEPR
jgi:hypothetical protein